MTKGIKFETLLEGTAKLLESLPEYTDKAGKVLRSVDSLLNGKKPKQKKKKFSIESGSVYSLVELKTLLLTIPDEALAKMSMTFTDVNSTSVSNIGYADYHYNKGQKEISFFQEE